MKKLSFFALIFIVSYVMLSVCSAEQFPNISGEWWYNNKKCVISQHGKYISFTNEFGSKSNGRFLTKSKVIADNWENGLIGVLENEGKQIRWNNGTLWTRRKSISNNEPRLPNMTSCKQTGYGGGYYVWYSNTATQKGKKVCSMGRHIFCALATIQMSDVRGRCYVGQNMGDWKLVTVNDRNVPLPQTCGAVCIDKIPNDP